ncbi:MAG: MarR family winged helix-turn-helix transcriptional regulator [Pseudomonadota bacterium]|jgi:DNA-binding MarR family transcriptional regulator
MPSATWLPCSHDHSKFQQTQWHNVIVDKINLSSREKPGKRAQKPMIITDLLSSRLHTLAALSAASTSLRVERKFSLTLLEWRSLGQLAAFAPLSLKDLAHRAGMDKSYASRTVSGLIERGFIASERNDADARGVMLTLTAKGQALYQQVIVDAEARNERLLRPLSKEDRQRLMTSLTALTERARQVLDEERLIQAGKLSDADVEPVLEVPLSARDVEAQIDIVELRGLIDRLGQIVRPFG